MNFSKILDVIEQEKKKLVKAFLSAISIYYGFKITKWLYKYFYTVWVTNKIPGLPMTLFLGNADKFVREHSAFLNGYLDCTNPFKDKSFCRLWIGTQPNISFIRCDHLDVDTHKIIVLLNKVLVESSKHTKKSFDYSFLTPWLNEGLLMSYGDKWQARRKLITPTFHYDILKDFFSIMNEQCEIMIDEIKKEMKKNKTINMASFVNPCSLDIICETAMGITMKAQKDKSSEYLVALEKIARLMHTRMETPLYWSDFIFNLTTHGKIHNKSLKTLHDYTRKVIADRLEEYEESQATDQHKKKRIALLDLLLKAHKEDPKLMSLEDIREEVDTFMFEGHDTTSAAVEWTCYCLARHPDIQRKVHEEFDKVIGTSSRPLTMDDLNELKYFDLVIKEALRIYPAVPMVSREITEDCFINGYKVLKGTTAQIFIYQIHRDERYYPEPEKFIPERFLPENSEHRPPFAYVPFSAGRRNCVGQRFALLEDKLLVANIFRHFQLECDQTLEDVIPDVRLVLRTEKPILYKLRNRFSN